MAETSLITITNIQTYREIDPKFNQIRFDGFVNEIQRTNLRDLLGGSLYYAFMADGRTAGIYADLLNGKMYTKDGETIQYYGLIPMLCYWWLTVAARESELFQSAYGSIQLVNNQQQSFESAREKERIAVSYMERAQSYANDTILFLNSSSASYPLWKGDDERNVTEFVSFRV